MLIFPWSLILNAPDSRLQELDYLAALKLYLCGQTLFPLLPITTHMPLQTKHRVSLTYGTVSPGQPNNRMLDLELGSDSGVFPRAICFWRQNEAAGGRGSNVECDAVLSG